MVLKLAEEWLATCGGCEVTILDIGEALLDILPKLEIVHMPVIMDHKYYGQCGEKSEIDIPDADVGLISGGIRHEEHKMVALEMRKKCKTIVAIGTCANYGGIPAMSNMWTTDEIFETVYRKTKTTIPADTPSENLPKFMDRVYAIDEVIKVDIGLPGCPTTPELVAEALTALLEGKPFALPERSVCDDCPLKREKKAVTTLKRPLEDVEYKIGEPLENIRCYMEQGYLCIGPVTKAGCGGKEKVPRCVKAYMTCRGCFGPIRKGANPMVDMMSALSSIGLDARQIEDRRALLNRFIGAHGRLRPLPKR
jgi:F420-non-reducing hydrogenase small subunit